MKRLLLAPILLALTSCSNNVTIKTNVGEKMLVKSATVSTKSFDKSDLINLINRNIEPLEKDYLYYQNQSQYFKNQYNWTLDFCVKNPLLCDVSEQYRYRDSWINNDRDAIKYEEKITNYKAFKSSINKNNFNLGETHKISIIFTPIYIDINNKKKVGDVELIYCFNPSLDKTLKEAWIKTSKTFEKENYENGLLLKKICDKYAKFN